MNKFLTDDYVESIEISNKQVFKYYLKNTGLFKLDINVLKGSCLDIEIVALTNLETKLNINLNHQQDTKSNLIFKAVTKDDGDIKAEINGVANKFATGVEINQQTKILAINDIKSKVKPNLLIANNEVTANHGVSIGNINDDHLYYLMSKGLSKKHAQEILIKGFLLGEKPNDELNSFYKED